MEMFILAGLVSFTYIFCKAFQQLNVVGKKYGWVVPTSMVMALCEVTIVASVVKTSVWIFIPIGLCGGAGCIVAMWLDTRRSKRG